MSASDLRLGVFRKLEPNHGGEGDGNHCSVAVAANLTPSISQHVSALPCGSLITADDGSVCIDFGWYEFNVGTHYGYELNSDLSSQWKIYEVTKGRPRIPPHPHGIDYRARS